MKSDIGKKNGLSNPVETERAGRGRICFFWGLGQGRSLNRVSLFHGFSTDALAGLLTDCAAVASLAAGAGISTDGLECLLSFLDLDDRCSISHLGYSPSRHGLSANAFACFHGHGIAVASFTAVTDVEFIADLEVEFVALVRKGNTGENQGKNNRHQCKLFLHIDLLGKGYLEK